MPPRSRTQSPQGPGGRRPRVAGLRRPGAGHDDADETTPVDTAGPAAQPADGGATVETADRSRVAESAPTEEPGPADGAAAGSGGAAGTSSDTGAVPETTAVSEPTESETTAASGTAASVTPSDPGTVESERSDDTIETAAAPGGDAATARPMPTGRARTLGRRRPGTGEAAVRTGGTTVLDRPSKTAPETTDDEATGGRKRRGPRSRTDLQRLLGNTPPWLPLVLVVVIVVCLVLAGLAFWRGAVAWNSGPQANTAVVDTAATAELVGQTRQGIEQVFSYDFTKLDDSLNAARTFGTGNFPTQYQDIFDRAIRGPATQQKLKQTATVLNIGVRSIEGDDASVMALVQFHAERTSTNQSTDAPGLLELRMQRVDGTWKLAELSPLTPQG